MDEEAVYQLLRQLERIADALTEISESARRQADALEAIGDTLGSAELLTLPPPTHRRRSS